MKAELNCPNCGAPLKGGECEYCGTLTEIPVDLMIGKEIEIRFEHDGVTHEFRTRVTSLGLASTCETTTLYADAVPYITLPSFGIEMSLTGTLVSKSFYGRENVLLVTKDRRWSN